MKLFFRKYGDGPPLIILHGLFGSSDNWTSIARSLEKDFTVYLPDLRNHGKSPHSDDHDYNSMREDLHELVTELNLDKFYLAGHSMGGKTAIAYALKWPEKLLGLLIADISPFVSGKSGGPEYNHHAGILNSMLSLDLSQINSRAEAEKAIAEKISSPSIRGFVLKNLERSHGNKFEWKLNAPSLLSNLEKIMEGIDRNDVFRYQVTGFPVIFIKGKESEYLPDSDYEDVKRIFPAAEIVEVEGAGHWIHADRPDEVIRNLKRLKELREN